MRDLNHECTLQASTSFFRQKEDIILKKLKEYLNGGLIDTKKITVCTYPNNVEEWHYENIAILRFFPMNISHKFDDMQYNMVLNQKYETLI